MSNKAKQFLQLVQQFEASQKDLAPNSPSRQTLSQYLLQSGGGNVSSLKLGGSHLWKLKKSGKKEDKGTWDYRYFFAKMLDPAYKRPPSNLNVADTFRLPFREKYPELARGAILYLDEGSQELNDINAFLARQRSATEESDADAMQRESQRREQKKELEASASREARRKTAKPAPEPERENRTDRRTDEELEQSIRSKLSTLEQLEAGKQNTIDLSEAEMDYLARKQAAQLQTNVKDAVTAKQLYEAGFDEELPRSFDDKGVDLNKPLSEEEKANLIKRQEELLRKYPTPFTAWDIIHEKSKLSTFRMAENFTNPKQAQSVKVMKAQQKEFAKDGGETLTTSKKRRVKPTITQKGRKESRRALVAQEGIAKRKQKIQELRDQGLTEMADKERAELSREAKEAAAKLYELANRMTLNKRKMIGTATQRLKGKKKRFFDPNRASQEVRRRIEQRIDLLRRAGDNIIDAAATDEESEESEAPEAPVVVPVASGVSTTEVAKEIADLIADEDDESQQTDEDESSYESQRTEGSVRTEGSDDTIIFGEGSQESLEPEILYASGTGHPFLLRPDGSLYVGPYHYHENTPMVGAKHIEGQKHDTLTRIDRASAMALKGGQKERPIIRGRRKPSAPTVNLPNVPQGNVFMKAQRMVQPALKEGQEERPIIMGRRRPSAPLAQDTIRNPLPQPAFMAQAVDPTPTMDVEGGATVEVPPTMEVEEAPDFNRRALLDELARSAEFSDRNAASEAIQQIMALPNYQTMSEDQIRQSFQERYSRVIFDRLPILQPDLAAVEQQAQLQQQTYGSLDRETLKALIREVARVYGLKTNEQMLTAIANYVRDEFNDIEFDQDQIKGFIELYDVPLFDPTQNIDPTQGIKTEPDGTKVNMGANTVRVMFEGEVPLTMSMQEFVEVLNRINSDNIRNVNMQDASRANIHQFVLSNMSTAWRSQQDADLFRMLVAYDRDPNAPNPPDDNIRRAYDQLRRKYGQGGGPGGRVPPPRGGPYGVGISGGAVDQQELMTYKQLGREQTKDLAYKKKTTKLTRLSEQEILRRPNDQYYYLNTTAPSSIFRIKPRIPVDKSTSIPYRQKPSKKYRL